VANRRIGILTGGGDAPGLNAVIRAFVKHACIAHGWDVVGSEDSFNGLLETPRRLQKLDLRSAQGLLHRGGTILGTTNHGDPFSYELPDGTVTDVSALLAERVAEQGLDGLVIIGGDGTMKIALRLMEERGVPVIGVPKTIDNDLSATDVTFGFQSAVDVATEALDRLHTTAEAHDRVMFLEVMGRDVGHIALHTGISGGADIILLPEIPYHPARLAAKIGDRLRLGRTFSTIVVAEGALPVDLATDDLGVRKRHLKAGGGAANIAMNRLEMLVRAEMRSTVLGHVQRGGSPVPFDRLLATRYGAHAVDLVAANRWGEMVSLQNGHVLGVPLREAAITRPVALDDELILVARQVGIELGAAL
jgi:ATP-dependent phosphofructokinase / diphosphate-dependent phosphofructokinase